MFLVFPSLVKVGKMVVGKIFQREQGVVIVEELELIFIALWHLSLHGVVGLPVALCLSREEKQKELCIPSNFALNFLSVSTFNIHDWLYPILSYLDMFFLLSCFD